MADTRTKILETAALCIAKHGIEKTTTRKIAEMAGVSRGLVPYYMPSREELLHEVITYIFEVVTGRARAKMNVVSEKEQLLNALRINFEEYLSASHYYACFLLSYYYCSFDKKFRKLHTEHYLHNRARAMELLGKYAARKGLTKSKAQLELKAEEILDLLDGGLLFYLAVKQTVSLEAYTERRMKIIEANLNAFFKE